MILRNLYVHSLLKPGILKRLDTAWSLFRIVCEKFLDKFLAVCGPLRPNSFFILINQDMSLLTSILESSFDNGIHYLVIICSCKWRLSTHQCIQDDSDAPDIAFGVCASSDQFRCSVSYGTKEALLLRFGVLWVPLCLVSRVP